MIKDYEDTSLLDFAELPEKTLEEKAADFCHYIEETKRRRYYNYRRISMEGSAPEMDIQDPYTGKIRRMIYLGSNDYLNLTKHPRTIEAGIRALKKYGSGAGSVPLLGGTLEIHRELEEKIAAFKGTSHGVIYTSGYGSNCGTLLSLLGKNDLAILDILDHASIIDGCKNTNLRFFKHNDLSSLEKVLLREGPQFRTKLIVVDGVYSMDGDIAPLDEIVKLAKIHGALVMVDEAHATGVIGKTGRGTPEHFNLEGQVDIVAGTFSKAIGVVGGFITANNPDLIEYIRFYSRSYIFSTAMTPQAAGSIIAALEVIQEEPEIREKLWSNIRYFKTNLLKLGFDIGNSETAIFPIILGNDIKVKEACRMLHEQDIYVNPVLYPAVKKSQARIRISLTAGHTTEHLDRTIDALKEVKDTLEL